jgi:DNA transformation protein and related proteins
MAVSPEYKEFVAEQLQRLGRVRMRGMFGGAGVYLDDLMFGLIFEETLYLKVDDRNRADYEAEGMEPFTFEMRNGDVGSLSYYEVPERLYDEPDELVQWARKSLDAMLAVKAAKAAKAERVAERKAKAASKKKATPVKASPSKKPAAKRKR